jgi:hypothetical protein
MAPATQAAAGGGAIYGLGIFGAFVYYWQAADQFWEYVLAFVAGLFWPAFGSTRSSDPRRLRATDLGTEPLRSLRFGCVSGCGASSMTTWVTTWPHR